MKINIAIYSRSVARGEKSFDLSTLFLLCNKHAFSVKNLIIKEEYDFDITEKMIKEPLVIFCDKKDIEVYEINLSYKFSAEREIFEGECIRLKNGINVVFIPLEEMYLQNFEKFLLENKSKKVSIFRLFGKTKRYVKKILAENGIKEDVCKVVEQDLLCDIYLTQSEDQFGMSEVEQRIGQLFFNEIYSQSELALSEVAVNLLKMNRYKIDIIETLTCGEISRQFAKCKEVLYEGLIPISNRALTTEGQMSGYDFQNSGECSVETNTLLCKSRLSLNGADIVLVLTAKSVDEGFQEIVSIADRVCVNTIKTTFKGDIEKTIRFSVNWALFNLVKKLSKKDFENK